VKNKLFAGLVLIHLAVFNFQLSTAHAQGTAFTYQGQLQNNGSPASGTYALTFSLFNTNTTGVSVAEPVTNNAVVITNGLFTVLIDFGPGVFTGTTNWLQIGVATNGVESFTALTPRQELTPTPNAIYAESANGLSGKLSAAQLTSIGNTNGSATGNFFVGPSGNSTMSGYWNTADGYQSLNDNTLGYANTAYGYQALNANASGDNNTAVGYTALVSNNSGSQNTAVGELAMSGNFSGGNNSAFGALALDNNTSGSFNTAIGEYTLYVNNGSYNSADGAYALYHSVTGGNNIALGYQAGYNITTGSSNIDIGNLGLSTDTNLIRIGTSQTQAFIAGVITGNGAGLTNLNATSFSGTFPANQLTSVGNTNVGAYLNFFVGPSGDSTTTGSYNTADGTYALELNTSGSDNTADGTYALALNTSGSDNTANGTEALYYNTSGSANTANGYGALYSNTSGSDNTAIGFDALEFNTNGYDNTANGYEALFSNQNGYENTADGYNALYGNTSGYLNVAVGQDAMKLNMVGYENVAIGHLALGNNTNDNQIVAIGYHALENDNAYGEGYSGNGDNTAVGYSALAANTDGAENTAVGYEALINNTDGFYNTAYGSYALAGSSGGEGNIAIGYAAGYGLTTGSGDIYIGNTGDGTSFSQTENNIIRIGTEGTQTATYLAGTVYANGVALTSDRNAKEHFQPVDNQAVLAKVAALPLTEWNYKTDKAGVQHIGPMAQDFHAAFQLDGADDKHISVVDEGGVALAAIQGLNQKLQDELNREDAENAKLKQQNDLLAERLNQVEAIVKQLAARK
jgi:hypothetical protein